MTANRSSSLKWLIIPALVILAVVFFVLFPPRVKDEPGPPPVTIDVPTPIAEPLPPDTRAASPLGTSDAVESPDALDIPRIEVNDLLKDAKPGRSPYTGNFTDLTPQEELAAMQLWERTRKEWGRFRGLSGSVKVSFVANKPGFEDLNLDVFIEVSAYDFDPNAVDWEHSRYPPAHRTTIRDRQGRWTWTQDTKTNETVLDCPDEKLKRQIQHFLTYVPYQLWRPADYLEHRHPDMFPRKDGSVSAFFCANQAMGNPEAVDVPNSWIFGRPILSQAATRDTWYFQNGLFTGIEFKDIGLRYTWSKYRDFNGFQWPMEMNSTFETANYDTTLTFGNDLIIDTSMKQ